jgi:uncharacterized membrane protein
MMDFLKNDPKKQNVADIERWISGVAGGALTGFGIARRSVGGALMAAGGAYLLIRGLTGYCNIYRAFNINLAKKTTNPIVSVPHGEGIKFEKTVMINRPPEELYRFWRNFENLPRFMNHLESVRMLDDKRSHWVAKGPAGTNVEWDAVIHNEIPNQLIAWRSVDGSDVNHAGSVEFKPAPGNKETEVKVVLNYAPPAGKLGAVIAKMFGEEPSQQIEEDLNRFKQLMESGQISEKESQTPEFELSKR